MKVYCSGELYDDPITTEECLDCAVKHQGRQPCGFGYRLLKSIFSGQEDRSNEIHVTDITGCLLKAYYDKKEPAVKYVHELLVLWIGRAVHEGLQQQDDVVESEIGAEKDGLVGRVDAIYNWGIEDAKTTRWMYPDKLPYGNHEDQVNLYRHLTGNEGRMQIQMIDMSGPTRCKSRASGVTCGGVVRMIDGIIRCPKCGNAPRSAHLGSMLIEIDVKDNVEEFVKERVMELQESLDMNTPPPPEPSFLCGYCPHVQCVWCQG